MTWESAHTMVTRRAGRSAAKFHMLCSICSRLTGSYRSNAGQYPLVPQAARCSLMLTPGVLLYSRFCELSTLVYMRYTLSMSAGRIEAKDVGCVRNARVCCRASTPKLLAEL